MARVTIVVPTYNVEPYIEACLESFVHQSNHDFVALVINDGSPANEQSIIDRYVQKYPYIQSIVKENGGYGSVLNRAALVCKTDYFMICDPDDTLEPNAVEILLNAVNASKADIIIGAKTLVYADSKDRDYDPSYNPDFANLKDQAIYLKGSPAFDQLFFVEPSPHAKLYRTEMVKKISFPEKVSYTDNVLYYLNLLQANSVMYVTTALSNYLINRDGNTRTDLRPTVMDAWNSVINSILSQSQAFKDIPDMFYYRMFESFKFVFNKIDFIQADHQVKETKLVETYSILEKLIAHSDQIIPIYLKQSTSFGKERKHDLALLNVKTSKQVFDHLVKRKLLGPNASLVSKFKHFVQTSAVTRPIYNIYHFHRSHYLAQRRPLYQLDPKLSMQIVDPIGQTFFGYYNRSCQRNKHIAYHRLQSSSTSYHQAIEICVDQKVVATSKAWNYQQGTLLQWISDHEIIFNDYEDHHYVSKIFDLKTQSLRTVDFPIYSVSSKGDFALSLNFKRLAKFRKDYGYFNESLNDIEDYDANDGIYYVDLKNNTQELWISFDTLTKLSPKESMKNAIHKVNHIDISPDDQHFIFLHRWIKEGVKYSRLIKSDLNKNMTILADDGMVSHCFWKSDSEIIAYLNDTSHGAKYYSFETSQKTWILKNLVDDGHPSFSFQNGLIVTDDYPDFTQTSKVYLSKEPYGHAKEVARFYVPKKYRNDKRCDLHPRFNQEGTNISIDTVYSGRRQLLVLDISKWDLS